MDQGIRDIVSVHYVWMSLLFGRYCPTKMAELAPGVVAVEDDSGECDVFFELDRWEFVYPEVWKRQKGEKIHKTLKKGRLEVLPGMGTSNRVTTIGKALAFAQSQLSPKDNETRWYDAPEVFFEV